MSFLVATTAHVGTHMREQSRAWTYPKQGSGVEACGMDETGGVQNFLPPKLQGAERESKRIFSHDGKSAPCVRR